MLPKLKNPSKYVGLGVAIRLCTGQIRKFIIESVDVNYDKDGWTIKAVWPANFEYEWISFECLGISRITPEMCFRNRGECIRYYLDKEIRRQEEEIASLDKEMNMMARKTSSMYNRKKELAEKLDALRKRKIRLEGKSTANFVSKE